MKLYCNDHKEVVCRVGWYCIGERPARAPQIKPHCDGEPCLGLVGCSAAWIRRCGGELKPLLHPSTALRTRRLGSCYTDRATFPHQKSEHLSGTMSSPVRRKKVLVAWLRLAGEVRWGLFFLRQSYIDHRQRHGGAAPTRAAVMGPPFSLSQLQASSLFAVGQDAARVQRRCWNRKSLDRLRASVAD
jgi:hypothetical protein